MGINQDYAEERFGPADPTDCQCCCCTGECMEPLEEPSWEDLLTSEESRQLFLMEQSAENGWLRRAEYDPEAAAEMEMEDAMGKS